MKETLKELVKDPVFWFSLITVIICIVVAVVLLYNRYHKTDEVQTTSQTIAETEQGVKISAEKAGFKLDDSQAQQVATVIREIRTENREPVYVVTTDGKNAKAESEQARKDNKADFSIVTDKNNPEYKIDLSKLDKNSKVELAQYNIQAYKKVIRTVDYDPFNKQASLTISRKISDDGKYIGVGAGYDFSHNRVIAKVSYSW